MQICSFAKAKRQVARFLVTDIFGQTVVGSFSAWDHVVKGHPEMADKEDLVKQAISSPLAVHETSSATRRLITGARITSGFWSGSFPVVLVEYKKSGVGFFDNSLSQHAKAAG